jgi:hypothetical protein
MPCINSECFNYFVECNVSFVCVKYGIAYIWFAVPARMQKNEKS